MKQNWIIGIGGSNADDVIVYRVFGSKNEVKKHLLSLVKEDKKNDKEIWDFGTSSLKEIDERTDGSFYAFGCYSDYHIDYTASPEMPVEVLGKKGKAA